MIIQHTSINKFIACKEGKISKNIKLPLKSMRWPLNQLLCCTTADKCSDAWWNAMTPDRSLPASQERLSVLQLWWQVLLHTHKHTQTHGSQLNDSFSHRSISAVRALWTNSDTSYVSAPSRVSSSPTVKLWKQTCRVTLYHEDWKLLFKRQISVKETVKKINYQLWWLWDWKSVTTCGAWYPLWAWRSCKDI